MNEKKVLVVSNQNRININNSVNMDISFPDNVHGLNLIDYVDTLIEKIVDNSSIEWIIYDLKIDNSNMEDMIIINSYFPHYIYNKYSNLNFIFLNPGSICQPRFLHKTEENPPSPFVNTISNGEVLGERSWVLRFDIFYDTHLEALLSNKSVNYGSMDKRYSFITNKALNRIIGGLIANYEKVEKGFYNIIPKDTHTEYELLNYVCWKKNYSNYIERSSSKGLIDNSIKTSKPKSLKMLWEYAGYEDIPSFKSLYDDL